MPIVSSLDLKKPIRCNKSRAQILPISFNSHNYINAHLRYNFVTVIAEVITYTFHALVSQIRKLRHIYAIPLMLLLPL